MTENLESNIGISDLISEMLLWYAMRIAREIMNKQTQQEFLQAVKNEIGLKWDELADLAGIKPRAFKTYRMPPTSKDFRSMNDLARNALIRVLEDHRKNK